jgi:hypothetical protein
MEDDNSDLRAVSKAKRLSATACATAPAPTAA